ncbi:MAG TPA: beta-propeller fold lactonase family protein [Actinomycetota bacterium]|nr:beta-propeller fold lactonase family protein [Actinomycetota bacterium]
MTSLANASVRPLDDNDGLMTIVQDGAGGGPQLIPQGCIDDNDTGPDDCAGSVDGLDRVRSVAVSPDGTSLYAVSELDDAIVHFDRDTTTGDLTFQGCIQDNDSGSDACAGSTDGLDSAIEVVVSPDGESVYATSYSDSAIVRFDRNTSTGALTPQGCIDDNDTGADDCAQSTDGLNFANSVMVSPEGDSVYVAGQYDDAIVRFDRDSNGALTPQGCIDNTDSSPDDCASSTDGLDGARNVAVSSDGKSVYVAAYGEGAVVHFDREFDGALTPQGCISDNDTGSNKCAQRSDGLNAAHSIVLSGDGRSAYVAGVFDDAIVSFRRDPSTGALTPGACIDDRTAGPDDCETSMDGLDGATYLALSPDGAILFASTTDDDGIAILARNTTSGSLSPAGCVNDNDTGADDCAAATDGLDSSIFVALSPDGESVYAAGYDDDAIIQFSVGSGGQPSQGSPCASGLSGLVSCWTAEGDANDSVGGNDGSVANGLTFATGKVGRAFRSTSSGNGHVSLGAPADLQLQDFSVAAWTKVGSTEFVDHPGHGMVSWGSGGWGFGLGGSISGAGGYNTRPGELFLTHVGSNVVGSTGMAISDTDWHHVAVTKAGGSVKFYLDAAEFVVPQTYQPTFTFTSTLGLGPPGGLPNSSVDAVHIFDRALTADEVRTLGETTGEPPQCRDSDAICGGSGDEDLQGTPKDEFIFGGGGNDEIDGGGGNDVIVGGGGNDLINAGPGKDKVTGGAGKDRIVGDGRGASHARAELSAAQAASSADRLSGGGGNDTILGQAGNDELKGDAGNDLLKGGGGVNDFNGGPGRDKCVLENRKDKTTSCEKKARSFARSFYPVKYLRT